MAYIGNTVQNQGFAPAIDYFSGNGVTVTFTLSRPVASVAQLIVAIDNVIQNPSTSFTVAGNSITFTSAPLSGTNNIWVEYTSLITTYQGISQDPTVIGDIRATGGYLAEGDFGNSFVDGAILDYVTGNGRITVGDLDGLTIYNGGTTARSPLLTLTANGALGVGTSPSYGAAGQVLQSNGSGSAPTWVNTSVYPLQYVVVAGGGGGGGWVGSGGGAGGYRSSVTGESSGGGVSAETPLAVISGTSFSVTVGAGGIGTSINPGGSVGTSGTNGGDSVFGSITSVGGGRGASWNSSGAQSGGSGGGIDNNLTGSRLGTAGQGYDGGIGSAVPNYAGSGGGGAGQAGQNATTVLGGNGGNGVQTSITGTATYYAGGGGGGVNTPVSGSAAGSGGLGGGGAGRQSNGVSGTAPAGTVNTGGGGGGDGLSGPSSQTTGGNGGSGIVIVRYLGAQRGTGGTVTSAGGYTIHTFTTSGTFTA